MLSAVSGLRAHQTKMDVIGNNIANVNTVAFKSGRVTFQEIFSQTLRGASAPDLTTGRGGTNPMQVGLGLGIGSIDNIMTTGNPQRTDNQTDLSIEGEGFFIVKGGISDTFRFTRAGNFILDEQANLTTADGLNVYGWDVDPNTGEIDTESELVPINLYNGKRIISAKQTSKATFEGNLDSSRKVITEITDPDDSTQKLSAITGTSNTMELLRKVERSGAGVINVPYTVYDSLGNDYTITLSFVKNEVTTDPATGKPVTTWFWYTVSDDTRQGILNHEYNVKNGLSATDPGAKVPDIDPTTVVPAQGYITFDDTGKLINVEPSSSLFPGIKLATDIRIEPDANSGTSAFDVTLDFSSLTQYNANSSVAAISVDGYPVGELKTFSIGSDGIITGVYSNGQMRALGMIALAFFNNPAGLEKVGSNLYIPTPNSGEFEKAYKPGTGGTGTLAPSTLEMSNVDLSKEFTEMIITQRGFQANSRIITASDEMLQELVNLKR